MSIDLISKFSVTKEMPTVDAQKIFGDFLRTGEVY